MKIVVENIFIVWFYLENAIFLHHAPPKLQFNPRQQTPAIKSHNHQNTTTTPPQQQQKSKSHRERSMGRRLWVEGEIEGEIEWRGVAIDENGVIWCVQSLDWSSGFTGGVEGSWSPAVGSLFFLSLSLSRSLSLHASTISLSLSLSLFSRK